MDATHFRQKAAHAREMAQSGDDIRLSRMLLEVALELDAEAEAMEADVPTERRRFQRIEGAEIYGARLHLVEQEADAQPVQLINLSMGGARFRSDFMHTPGTKVVLELAAQAVRLEGSILRVRDSEATMVFELASTADPALARLLRSRTRTDRVRA